MMTVTTATILKERHVQKEMFKRTTLALGSITHGGHNNARLCVDQWRWKYFLYFMQQKSIFFLQ